MYLVTIVNGRPRLSDNLGYGHVETFDNNDSEEEEEEDTNQEELSKDEIDDEANYFAQNTHQGKPVETIDLGNTEDDSRDSNESGSADEDLEVTCPMKMKITWRVRIR